MGSKNLKSKPGKLDLLGALKESRKKITKNKDSDLDFEAFKEALAVDNYAIRVESMELLRHA